LLFFSISPYFFSGLHLPKLQKPQNKIKQSFLPTLKIKQGAMVKKNKIKGKLKKGESKLPLCQSLAMAPMQQN
jgi:hypothetical protein